MSGSPITMEFDAMKHTKLSTMLRTSCLAGTLAVVSALLPQISASANPQMGPVTDNYIKLGGTNHLKYLTIKETIAIPAASSTSGTLKGPRARIKQFFAHGISVSLVPIVDGQAASLLSRREMPSVTFAPHRGTQSSYAFTDPAGRTLSATSHPFGDGGAGGVGKGAFIYTPTATQREKHYTYTPTADLGHSSGSSTSGGGCQFSQGPTTDTGLGTFSDLLSVTVRVPVPVAVARKLATALTQHPGGVGVVVSNGTVGCVCPSSPAQVSQPNGGNGGRGGLFVGLDPSRGTSYYPIVGAVHGTVANRVATAAFSPNPILTQGPHRAIGVSASNTSCGSVMGTTSAGLAVASGFLNFVPVVGPALGAVGTVASATTGLMGDNAGDACVQAEFSLLNGQLADQEGQIQSLQTDYALQQNQIYEAMVNGATAQTNLDLTNYNDALQAISPSTSGGPGVFGKSMQDLGFWQPNYTPVPGATIAGSSSGEPFIQTVAEASSASATFPGDLNDLSGSAINVNACSTTACPKSAFGPDLPSALVMLWTSEAQQLKATAKLDRAQGSNVVPLFDQYNNAITEQFQNSLGVLQQAYSLEAMVNQLNYDHATTSCTWGQAKDCTMIGSFGGIPGTLYNYCTTTVNGVCPSTTTAAQTTAYNQAQRQLAKVYSWRVSQLYDTALGFLETDVPIAPQAYPTTTASGTVAGNTITSGPIAYSSLLGASLPGLANVPASPLASLPAAVTSGGSTWESNGALYQFSGLFDANQCATSIIAANLATGASAPPPATPCSAIFLDGQGGPVNQASYTGNILQPYTSQGGSVVLTGVEQANLLMCNPSNAALGWYTPPAQNTGNAAGLVSGAWYLNCGNWASVTNTTTCFPGANCPIGWSDPVSGYSWLYSQYYFFGTGSYPGLNNGANSVSLNDKNDSGTNAAFNGAPGCGGSTNVAWFTNGVPLNGSGGGSATSASPTPCGASMYVKKGDSYQGVTGLRAPNQASSQSGLAIPVGWNESQNGNTVTWTWEPEQVSSSAIGTYGFTCSDLTCTMVDGSQWTLSDAGSGGTYFSVGLAAAAG